MSAESLGRAFGDLQKQVGESVERQERVVADIQEQHQQFIVEKGGAGSAREEAMKCLAQAHDAFMELKSNLIEGTKFYNDLTQLLVTFQNKVSDFCFARRTEKEDLLKDLTASLAAMGVSETPNIPAHHVQEPIRPPRKGDAPNTEASATGPSQPPGSQPNPYAGAPGPLPYPQQAPNIPMPYQAYTPMPGGYNPYVPYPQQPYGFPAGYQQPPGYPGYPGYPPQPPQ
jgi:programmed cell death 6-interacting protein